MHLHGFSIKLYYLAADIAVLFFLLSVLRNNQLSQIIGILCHGYDITCDVTRAVVTSSYIQLQISEVCL